MKIKAIKFFSLNENAPVAAKAKEKSAPTGYISSTGKLVLPSATLEELGIEADSAKFKIGAQQGKRTLKHLYLIPAGDQDEAFSLEKSGRGYVIPLALILKKGGVDFENVKFTFSISLFNYEEGVVGYELALENPLPKPVYTGKPRGRKPRTEQISE